MGKSRLIQTRKLIRRPDLDDDDFAFACYLGRQNWSQKFSKIAESINYFSKDGELIAVAFYNNQSCSYKVHGLEEVQYVDNSFNETGS